MATTPEPTTPELVTRDPTTAAVIRKTVPMNELAPFFDTVFDAVMRAAEEQQVALAGPPFAVYFGTPSEVVDVAAGFPTLGVVSETAGGVVPFELPGGRAVQLVHVGAYDTLGEGYGRVTAWMGEQGLTPAPLMWETYLTEPAPDGDPAANQTLITWPVSD